MILDLAALVLLLAFVWGVANGVPPAKRPALLASLAGVLAAVATVLTGLRR